MNKFDGIYTGPSIPLGFANHSFLEAVKNQPKKHQGPRTGERFEAFVIEKECPTFRKVKLDVIPEDST